MTSKVAQLFLRFFVVLFGHRVEWKRRGEAMISAFHHNPNNETTTTTNPFKEILDRNQNRIFLG
jgi:hypothetical protein